MTVLLIKGSNSTWIGRCKIAAKQHGGNMIDSGTFDMVHLLTKSIIQFSGVIFAAAVVDSWYFAVKYGDGKTFLFGVGVFAPALTLLIGGVFFFSQTYPVFSFDNLKNTKVTASLSRFDISSEKSRVDVPCVLSTSGKSHSLYCTFVRTGDSQSWQLWETRKYDETHPKEAALRKACQQNCSCS